jgi:biopolymer transport protein ExbB
MFALLSESLFMLPLLLCSLIAVAVIVHRLVSLRKAQVLPDNLVRALEDGEKAEIQSMMETDASSLGRVCREALTGAHADRAAATSSAESCAREEVTKLQAGLSTLEVIITIAPLLGLLGTVSGLVTVFSGLGGAEGSAAPSGSGIVVIAHGYFQRKIDQLTVRMERVLHRAIERFYPAS